MFRIASRWKNRGMSDVFSNWRENFRKSLEVKMTESASAIIQRAVKRWMMQAQHVAVTRWFQSLRMEQMLDALERRQAMADRSKGLASTNMATVVKRWLFRAAAVALHEWHEHFKDDS